MATARRSEDRPKVRRVLRSRALTQDCALEHPGCPFATGISDAFVELEIEHCAFRETRDVDIRETIHREASEIGKDSLVQSEKLSFVAWLFNDGTDEHGDTIMPLGHARDVRSDNENPDRVFMATIWRLPRHMLRETLASLPSVLSVSVFMIGGGFTSRTLVETIPGFSGNIREAVFHLAEMKNIRGVFLGEVPGAITSISYVLSIVVASFPWRFGKRPSCSLMIIIPLALGVYAGKAVLQLYDPSKAHIVDKCCVFVTGLPCVGVMARRCEVSVEKLAIHSSDPRISYCGY
eukprot:TRINITY_DN16314_c0_g1_i1.p1 TRINITY_DN16314_c0_g1~~TRINITY_DN16314_c0_g1_i1.p1  ORF type:complete len:304 (-),score=22.77 TRINITY_DN16314_c0_g1_i1:951-1826(-)